jgi:hypothetical protein
MARPSTSYVAAAMGHSSGMRNVRCGHAVVLQTGRRTRRSITRLRPATGSSVCRRTCQACTPRDLLPQRSHTPSGVVVRARSRTTVPVSTTSSTTSAVCADGFAASGATHRDHAIVEQVIAELKNGALAHLPSGVFAATPPGWPAPRSPTTSPGPPAHSPEAAPPRPHRHDPRAADHHPGPDRALRAPPSPALTAGLALRARPGRAVPPRPARPPPRSRLTPVPSRARPETISGSAGQTGSSTTPTSQTRPQRSTTPTGKDQR